MENIITDPLKITVEKVQIRNAAEVTYSHSMGFQFWCGRTMGNRN